MAECHLARSISAGDGERGGVLECRSRADDLDLPAAGQRLYALRELPDDRVKPTAQRLEIDCRLAEVNAPGLCICGVREQACGMQKRFRRNAAAQEAGTAQLRVFVDQDR